MLHQQLLLHVVDIILDSLVVDEVCQSSRDVQVLGSLPLRLFVGKIYIFFGKSQLSGTGKTNSGVILSSNEVSHEGRALMA